MKRLISEQLNVGMITAEDIYSLNGQLLIPRGIALTEGMIDMIRSHSIRSIRIEESIQKRSSELSTSAPASMKNSITDEEVKSKHRKEVYQYTYFYQQHLEKFKTTINDLVRKNSDLNIDDVLDQTLDLMKLNGNTVNILEMLIHMREYDDDIYSHSINVALMCNVLASWLQLSEPERRLAAACGLFHDIGKMAIPEEILKKPEPLTPAEWDVIHRHPEKGYHILSKLHIDDSIKKCALMHHEKCDGSGYPHKLRGSQIDQYAKIVTICDIYNAMTSNRCYRKALSPFRVIDDFEKHGLQKFDTRSILIFLENVVNTYLNCPVRLNNGMTGYVVFINRAYLGRPTVQCGNDFIDLSIRTDLEVAEMIPITSLSK